MNTPTFSTISDLYSPTQLQRALVEAHQIAHDLLLCCAAKEEPRDDLSSAYLRLLDAATDASAEYEASMKRTAPKVVSGG